MILTFFFSHADPFISGDLGNYENDNYVIGTHSVVFWLAIRGSLLAVVIPEIQLLSFVNKIVEATRAFALLLLC